MYVAPVHRVLCFLIFIKEKFSVFLHALHMQTSDQKESHTPELEVSVFSGFLKSAMFAKVSTKSHHIKYNNFLHC